MHTNTIMFCKNYPMVRILHRMASSTANNGSSGTKHAAFVRTNLSRRPVKKIPLGKSRPAIYYQFDQYVELTDGSVIMRRSQYPNDELRLLQDQRNNPLWNPSREDLVMIDPNATSQVDKFNKRFSGMFGNVEDGKKVDTLDNGIEEATAKIDESTSIQKVKMDTEMSKLKETPAKKAQSAKDSKPQDAKTQPTAEDDIDDYLSALDDSFGGSSKTRH